MAQRRTPCRLCDLRLLPDELKALSTQGFVIEERRGKRSYYKLRFRCHGRQRVRYLGSCAEVAEQIRLEVDELQRWHKRDREFARLSRRARVVMRDVKSMLEPLLGKEGCYFYGNEVRTMRSQQ